MVHADIADEDGVRRQRLVDLERRTLWIDRRGVVREARRNKTVPLLAVNVDLRQPLLPRVYPAVEIGAPIELGMDLAQEGADISHQAELDRIIPANLFRINVDMDELCRRNGEGVAGNPGAGGAVVEAHAEREQHVS